MFLSGQTQRRRGWALLWFCLGWLAATPLCSAQTCKHLAQPAFYVTEKYKVREIRIKSWLGFLLPLPREFGVMKLPLQPGDDFSLEKRDAGRQLIADQLKEVSKNSDLRYRVQVVTASIVNCRETQSPPELDVVYWMFTSDPYAYFSHPWELKSEELERPAAAAAATQARNFLTVKPYLGYNRTQQLFGGTKIQMRAPGSLFDALQLTAAGSSAGNEIALALSGSRAPAQTFLNVLEYRLGYRRSDLPAENNRLREGLLQLQFFGATRPLGNKSLIARFGISLEGGNQQTHLTAAADNAHSLASSGYGGLKTFFGVTLGTQRFSFAGSYGLQVGTRGATTAVDFVKHVGDAAFTASWLNQRKNAPGKVHKTTTLEVQFTGGAIQTLGKLPVAERFFGGNAVQDFIAGGNWRMRSGPLIRSIPQNRLNASSALGAVGGTGFFSLNFTASRPVWGYPIIPKEIARDAEFVPALNGAKRSARSILKGVYLSKLNVFETLITHTTALDADLAKLVTLLDGLADELADQLPEDEQEEYAELKPLTRDRAFTLRKMLEDRKNLPSKLSTILKDTNPAACQADPDSCSLLTRLGSNLERLAALLNQARLTDASTIANETKRSLTAQQSALLKEFEAVDMSEADRLADADMRVITPVLDSFVNELNWVAVSPVAVFDVARLWPDRFGTRFGIGGGMRVTVVNFHITLGYAVNPQPRLREGRGAFFFAMDVTNLFR